MRGLCKTVTREAVLSLFRQMPSEDGVADEGALSQRWC